MMLKFSILIETQKEKILQELINIKMRFVVNNETLSDSTKKILLELIKTQFDSEEIELAKILFKEKISQEEQSKLEEIRKSIIRTAKWIINNFPLEERKEFFRQTIGLRCGYTSILKRHETKVLFREDTKDTRLIWKRSKDYAYFLDIHGDIKPVTATAFPESVKVLSLKGLDFVSDELLFILK